MLSVAVGVRSIAVAALDEGEVFPVPIGGGDNADAEVLVGALRRGDVTPLRRFVADVVTAERDQGREVGSIVLVGPPATRDALEGMVGAEVDGHPIVASLDDTAATVSALVAEFGPAEPRLLIVDTDAPSVSVVAIDDAGLTLVDRVIGATSDDAGSAAAAIGAAIATLDVEELGPDLYVTGLFADAPEVVGPFTAAGWRSLPLRSTTAAEGGCRLAAGTGPLPVAEFAAVTRLVGPNAWDFDARTHDGSVGGDLPTTAVASDMPTAEQDLATHDGGATDDATATSPSATDRPTDEMATDEVSAEPRSGPGDRIPLPVALAAIGAALVAGVFAITAFGDGDVVLPEPSCTGSATPATAPAAVAPALGALPDGLVEVWRVDGGGPASGVPVALGDVAVVATLGTDDAGSVVTGFDAAGGGEVLWEHELDGQVWASPAIDDRFDDGLVWVADSTGELVALGLDGETVASCDLPTAGNTPLPVSTSAGELVIVGTEGGFVRAIDPEAATQRWSASIAGEPGDAVRGLAAVSNTLVAATSTGRVVVIDAVDGEILGETSLDEPIVADPRATSDGRGFVLATLEGTVVRVDPTGAVVWTTELDDAEIRGPIAVFGDEVWVGSSDGQVRRLTESSGDLAGSSTLDGAVDGGLTAVADSVVSGDDSALVIVHAADGSEVARAGLDGAVNGGVGVWDQGLLVMDSAGFLRRLDP